MTDVPGGLITLEYAAEGLNFTGVGSQANAARDADLTAYIQAATPLIENQVGPVLQVTKTLTFDGGVTAIVLPNMATAIVSVVEVGNTLVQGTAYWFDPTGSIVYCGTPVYPRVFYPGRQAISITYQTGFATVPATLQLAARELVRFWWQQGKAAVRPAYSDAVESAAPAFPQGFALPKRVIELLEPYMGTVGFA